MILFEEHKIRWLVLFVWTLFCILNLVDPKHTRLRIRGSEGYYAESKTIDYNFPPNFVKESGYKTSHAETNVGQEEVNLENSKSTSIEIDASTRVHLPSLSCSIDTDCLRHSVSEPLICKDGQCICTAPYCWVYYYQENMFTAQYIFTCDTCGQLGSSCNVTSGCDYPGECKKDGFCHCHEDMGEPYHGICVKVEVGLVLQLVSWGIGVLFIMFSLFFGIRICYQRDRNGRRFNCFGTRNNVRNSAASGTTSRGQTVQKSPAYSMSVHINSRFNESDENVDVVDSTTETTNSSSNGSNQETVRSSNINNDSIRSSNSNASSYTSSFRQMRSSVRSRLGNLFNIKPANTNEEELLDRQSNGGNYRVINPQNGIEINMAEQEERKSSIKQENYELDVIKPDDSKSEIEYG